MSDQPIPTPADVAPKPAAPTHEGAPSATTSPEPVATAPATEPTDAKPNVWENPEAAKAEIERLRRENGAARTNAKQQAAEEARTALATEIGRALGLVKDEPADPAKLTEQLTASQNAAKQARVELAVFRSAESVGADPQALLDSASFLKKAADLDPNDTAGLAAAMREAVEANPRLGAAPASRVPAPNPAQGSSASGVGGTPQLGLEDLRRMSPAEIDKATREGRFANLLGQS